jgi:hypothetical protein
MPVVDRSQLIYPGSPLYLQVDEDVIQTIRKKNNRTTPPEITVSIVLRAIPVLERLVPHYRGMIQTLGTTPDDMKHYSLGYDVPFATMILAYTGNLASPAEALRLHAQSRGNSSRDRPVVEIDEYLANSIEDFMRMYIQEPSGRLIFRDAEERPILPSPYYFAGARAAKDAYMKYTMRLGADYS